MIITSLRDIDLIESSRYDIVVIGLSSESRATNIVKKYNPIAKIKICVACTEKPVHSFVDNETLLRDKQYAITDIANISDLLLLSAKDINAVSINILVDVSCMSRPTMATLLATIASLPNFTAFNITFSYSLASFTSPLNQVSLNEAIEPVHPIFSGWPSRQANPTSLITGLGYERDKAEGASEYLDPSEQWGFVPVSQIPKFLEELEKNNESLLTRLHQENKVIKYDIHRPSRTFGQLEIVISDLVRRTNPILLPFGPKIFFILCLIQSLCHPEVGVWHVTGDADEAPVDRKASNIEIGFKVELRRNDSEQSISTY